MTRQTSNALIAVPIAVLFGLGALGPTDADAKGKVKYIYLVTKVDAAKGVKSPPTKQVRSGLGSAIETAEAIVSAIPDGAPDHVKAPEKFKRFLKRKRLRAFRVNLEITRYEQTVETIDDKGHKRVGAHISVRLFGETVPDRVMAFAGSGSATVKLDVGKKVRDPDRAAANREAIAVAIDDALKESLTKLSAPKKKKRRRKK